MKGVSEVIAIILILMIVIALSALAYTWFSGIFASMTASAGTAVTTTTQAMQTQFNLESAGNTSTNAIRFIIRNTGTQPFNCSDTKISVYIDGTKVIATRVGVTDNWCPAACGAGGCMMPGGYKAVYAVTFSVTGCTALPGTSANTIKAFIETGLANSAYISCSPA